MAEKNSNLYEFTKGIIKQNPTLVTLLGMCPTLAVTTMAKNGIGMGLATTFVLVCSNFVISLLKNVIPKAVRLPCFIVIIAGFVTLIEFLMKGYIPELYSALGVFLSLITVNCIILGRAEAFASKNKIFPSILDGLGMGLGFTLSLFTFEIVLISAYIALCVCASLMISRMSTFRYFSKNSMHAFGSRGLEIR